MKQKLLIDAIEKNNIEWSTHALQRMLQRGISRAAVKNCICEGELIENYPDDTPFPSALFFGKWQNQPLHTVIAYDASDHKVFLITAYRPDEKHFQADFKTRKK